MQVKVNYYERSEGYWEADYELPDEDGTRYFRANSEEEILPKLRIEIANILERRDRQARTLKHIILEFE